MMANVMLILSNRILPLSRDFFRTHIPFLCLSHTLEQQQALRPQGSEALDREIVVVVGYGTATFVCMVSSF
ncbi:hypothetical protein IQ07DRAFT_590210 [Pyrenochaeta sp. DS3sAY3a]|nr:hypothetical protein IQ07DRAFT_590210 [Pyrenochaeta sp. DS3sAY3a]